MELRHPPATRRKEHKALRSTTLPPRPLITDRFEVDLASPKTDPLGSEQGTNLKTPQNYETSQTRTNDEPKKKKTEPNADETGSFLGGENANFFRRTLTSSCGRPTRAAAVPVTGQAGQVLYLRLLWKGKKQRGSVFDLVIILQKHGGFPRVILRIRLLCLHFFCAVCLRREENKIWGSKNKPTSRRRRHPPACIRRWCVGRSCAPSSLPQA